jgi:hypothetical protein
MAEQRIVNWNRDGGPPLIAVRKDKLEALEERLGRVWGLNLGGPQERAQ